MSLYRNMWWITMFFLSKENAWGKSDIPAECFGFTLKTICSWWFSLNPGHFMKIYVFAFHKGTLSQSRSLQRRTLQRILAIIHVGCLCKCCVHMWESLMRAPETSAIWDVTRRQWLSRLLVTVSVGSWERKIQNRKLHFFFLGFMLCAFLLRLHSPNVFIRLPI